MAQNNFDFDKLKEGVNIVEIVGKYVTLKKRGAEHVGHCPFHADKKASLMVNETKQVWGCFACGGRSGSGSEPSQRSSGDVIDFLLRWGKTYEEINNELGGGSIDTSQVPIQNTNKKREKPKAWNPLKTSSQVGQIVHYKYGKPSGHWVYVDEAGKKMLVVCRFDLPDGTKVVLPYTYCTDGKTKQWRWQNISKNRPLYNLDKLGQRPNATVMVVEGEKTANAAERLFPKMVATTWSGGSKAIDKTDWTPLQGRKILLWPDNDKGQRYGEQHPKAGELKPFHEQAGNMAMLDIANILKETCKLRWVRNGEGFPDKWDIADAVDWDEEKAKSYVRANNTPIPYHVPEEMPEIAPQPQKKQKGTPKPSTEPVPHATNAPVPETVEVDKAQKWESVTISEHTNYFSFLGYEKEYDGIAHVFFVQETKTIIKYSSSRLSRISSLIQIAPLDFWESTFSTKRGGKVNMDMAVNWMCRVSHEKGFFSANRIRGRGAWVDDGRIVIHCGDKLIVNGRTMPLGNIKGKYFYEASNELDFSTENPLDTKEANKLMDVIKLLNFERNVDYYMLAGWCVVAIMCGALVWRPHLWITGGAGSGKSWVLLNIVRRLLGNMALAVQSETSEPGLRQLLRSDSLPVVFDEAEGEDEHNLKRMQSVLTLMRASSADDGGILVKGTASGSAKSYQIRSCFVFGSIGVSAHQQSDKSRITIVSLKTGNSNDPEQAKKWSDLQKIHLETFTDEFIKRLQARVISLIPVILENAKTFSKAATALLGEQRTGDQVGTLVAGAYSLYSNSKISYEKALVWLGDKNWDEEKNMDEGKDEIRLLTYLLEYVLKVDTAKGIKQKAIGELVGLSIGTLIDDPSVTDDSAKGRLMQVGVCVDGDFVYFANSSSNIRSILRHTPWAVNHSKILVRVKGAVSSDEVYFASGIKSRAVGIPLSMLGRYAPADIGGAVITNHATFDGEQEDLPF